MTKIYTAGEHVRIIKADPGFNDELGENQVGLVGTVKTGSASGGAYIKFPHHEGDLYYLSNEIEPVGGTPTEEPKPEPEKEYLFREGDHVRYTGPNQSWKGSEFTVDNDVEKTAFSSLVRLTATKVPESLATFGYKVGSNVGLTADTVEKFTPAPEPKFKIGDWVKVTGRNDKYDGIVGTIDAKEWGKFWGVTGTDGEKYQFAEDKLVPTEEPYVPKFKDGDWAKVPSGYGDYSGKVFEVTNGDKSKADNVELQMIHPTDKSYKWFGHFPTDRLEKAEKPAEPHWTEAKPVGSLAQVTYNNGEPDRALLKVSDTEWLHLYQNNSSGKVGCGTKRSLEATKNLMHSAFTVNWKSDVRL